MLASSPPDSLPPENSPPALSVSALLAGLVVDQDEGPGGVDIAVAPPHLPPLPGLLPGQVMAVPPLSHPVAEPVATCPLTSGSAGTGGSGDITDRKESQIITRSGKFGKNQKYVVTFMIS